MGFGLGGAAKVTPTSLRQRSRLPHKFMLATLHSIDPKLLEPMQSLSKQSPQQSSHYLSSILDGDLLTQIVLQMVGCTISKGPRPESLCRIPVLSPEVKREGAFCLRNHHLARGRQGFMSEICDNKSIFRMKWLMGGHCEGSQMEKFVVEEKYLGGTEP
jgi:hypothetical protein